MAGRDLFAVDSASAARPGRDLFSQEQPITPAHEPVVEAAPTRPSMGEMFGRYRRGEFNPAQSEAFMELMARDFDAKGRIPGAPVDTRSISQGSQFRGEEPQEALTPRQQAMKELAGEVGPLQSFLIGAGEGLTTIGRGVGLVEPAGEIEQEAMAALSAESPIATTVGQAVGEAAPFLIPGTAAGRIPSLAGRALATGAVTAAEGGLIQAGRGEDVVKGAGIGGAMGMGAEIIFPIIGKLGRKVFQRVTGRQPAGAMLDASGRPTPELQQALDAENMSFDELEQDAIGVITGQKAGAVPEQVARKAQFAEEGIPLTKGELSEDFRQQATEQRLLESAEDTAAEPLRQFKLKQSEAIKENLRSNLGLDVTEEETGQLIQGALTGRKKLLRTQKNELYEKATENAKEIGGVPILIDNLSEAIPDTDTFEDLAITAPQAMKSLDQILTKYGIKEPTKAMVEEGFEPTPLTIQNFERFRKTLNAITKGDITGAASVAVGPIKEALDTELAEIGTILKSQGVAADIVEPLVAARKTVRQLKTEFSPKSIIGKVVDLKKDGVTPITEASKVYSKLTARSAPVEETRRVVKSLLKSGEKGKQALASMQSSTIMDLIDAGFGTESRKISGIKTFNPIAFKRRLEKIGPDKMKSLFSSNKAALRKINNIDKIASAIIPPSGAQPKGSASVILDLMNNLGLASISAKVPGGALLVGSMRKIAQPVKTGVDVRRAIKADPDVIAMRSLVDKQFPGIASAIGIPYALETEQK